MNVVFQDDDFVAIDKPSGWLSVPSRVGEAETRPIAGIELERTLGLRIFPVHRLDAEVSGLLLFAKNATAHREANRAFEDHLVHKEYQAFSVGPLPTGITVGTEQEWKCVLARGKKRAFEAPHGKDSFTLARCLGEIAHGGQAFLDWRLSPRTGRSHQLRYEMYRHERPILGDVLYGSQVKAQIDGIALRAITIDVTAAKTKGLLKKLPDVLNLPRLPLSHWLA